MRGERRARREAARQVGVGDEQPPEGEQVGEAHGDDLLAGLRGRGLRAVEVPDQRPRPAGAQVGQRPVGPALDDVQVGEAQRVEGVDERPVGALRVLLGDLVLRVVRGDAQADAPGPDLGGHGLHDVQREPQPPGAGAAVPVGAPVGVLGEELLDEVAVRPVHLHPVEPRPDGVAGRGGEVGDRRVHLGGRHGAGRDVLDVAAARVDRLPLDPDGRGRDGCRAAREVEGVGHPSHVPELRVDRPSGGVDGVGDLAPSGDLRVADQARDAGSALAERVRPETLADDQPGGRALRVVRGGQRMGDAGGVVGAAPGHGRHDDAVGRPQTRPFVGEQERTGHRRASDSCTYINCMYMQRLPPHVSWCQRQGGIPR